MMHLRCGGIFGYYFTANLSLSLTVKEFWKLVKIWQSYCHEFGGLLFFRDIVLRLWSWSWNKSLVLILVLKKKSWSRSWSWRKSLDIFKTLMQIYHRTASCCALAIIMLTMTTTAERNISPPNVVASYLAFIQLILDGPQAGITWQLVSDTKQFACLKPLLESIFCTPCTSAPVERVFSHGLEVCFSDLTEQACPTSCCAIWCLSSTTQTIDICVTFVVIISIIANAQRDAANICNCKVLVLPGVSLSN